MNQYLFSNIEAKYKPTVIPTFDNCKCLEGFEIHILNHTDYFYNSKVGILKMRHIKEGTSSSTELIHYERTNESKSRESKVVCCPVIDCESMDNILSKSNSKTGVLKKERIALVGENNTVRLHFDTLTPGDETTKERFIEIEVKYDPHKKGAEEYAQDLFDKYEKKIGLDKKDIKSESYYDLFVK